MGLTLRSLSQDTNTMQYELMKILANACGGYVSVVGDPDQSSGYFTYSFVPSLTLNHSLWLALCGYAALTFVNKPLFTHTTIITRRNKPWTNAKRHARLNVKSSSPSKHIYRLSRYTHDSPRGKLPFDRFYCLDFTRNCLSRLVHVYCFIFPLTRTHVSFERQTAPSKITLHVACARPQTFAPRIFKRS
jgi:hypothetical protein